MIKQRKLIPDLSRSNGIINQDSIMIRNGWFRGQAKVAKAADIAIIIHTLPTFPSFRGIKPFDVTRIFTEERFFALQFRIFFFSRGLISLLSKGDPSFQHFSSNQSSCRRPSTVYYIRNHVSACSFCKNGGEKKNTRGSENN